MKETCTDDKSKIPVKAIFKTYKSICKIVYYLLNGQKVQGTGFFMKIDDNLKCVITNHHVISENLLNNNININIILHNNKKINMQLNNRYIMFYENIDITVIELKEIDNILNDIDLLQYDLNYITGYEQYKDMDVFTLQYPKEDIEVASGKILDIINNFEFKHNINTEQGSSGSPIILLNVLKVIGIHKQGDRIKPINYGSFIGEIFKNNDELKNDKDRNKINIQDTKSKNEILDSDVIGKTNIKDISKNISKNCGEYNEKINKNFININSIDKNMIKSIFNFLDEKRKLNIIKYNRNYQNQLNIDIEDYEKESGKLKIGEKNGNVKIYLLNSNKLLFDVEYLNGKKHGKAKEYNEYGVLKFEGEYLNGKKNGKGKEYYDNGKIQLEGE